MKKFIIFLVAVALTSVARAGVTVQTDNYKIKTYEANNDFKFKKSERVKTPLNPLQLTKTGQPASKSHVVTQRPDGELYFYHRTGVCVCSNYFDSPLSAIDNDLEVVIDDEGRAFIHNPIAWYERAGAWVEGTIDRETGLITIPTGQFLEYYDDYDYGVQLMWGSTYVEVDESNGVTNYFIRGEVDNSVSNIYFQIQGDEIRLLGSEGHLDADIPESYCATGLFAFYSDDDFWAGVLEFNVVGQVGLLLTPAVPADPVIDSWRDYGNESGFNCLNFTLPDTDVDGNPLNEANVSYSIFIDNDQLFTFDYDTYYYNIDEDMTEIPYSVYSQGYDFYPYRCYFYRTNGEGYERFFNWRIGIQAHYTVDGVKNSSQIVYLEVFDNPYIIPGDLNMDGKVSIDDVVVVIEYLLGNEPEGISITNADIDNNGIISIGDVIGIIDILLNGV